MQLPIKTTLADIWAADPLIEGFDRICDHLGVSPQDSKHHREPFPVAMVLESNPLPDALWVLDYAVSNRRISSLLAADYAERVLHLFEEERPGDDRPRKAIEVARNADASEEDRAAAEAAAGESVRAASGAGVASVVRAPARAAAWTAAAAARDSARDSAEAAARNAALAAARAARDSARAALWYAAEAARSAAGDGARNAVWEAASVARDAAGKLRRYATSAARADERARRFEGSAQRQRLLQYLQHGESASSMPWPEPPEAV